MERIIAYFLFFCLTSIAFSQPSEYLLLSDPLEVKQKFEMSSYFYSKAKGHKIEQKVLKKAVRTGKKLKLSEKDYLEVFPNFLLIKKDERYGIYTLNGKEILKCEYTSFEQYDHQEMFKIGKERRYGYFNATTLELVIPCEYKEIELIDTLNMNRFKVNLSSDVRSENYGIIDSNQNRIAEGFQKIDYWLDSEWILAQKNDKWGYIDKNNNIKIPFEYEGLERFTKYELVPAQQGNFWGLINRSNQWVVKPIYDNMMFAFQDGLLRVEKDGLVGFLNKKGDVFIELKYERADGYARAPSNVIRATKTNGKMIIFDISNGKELCEEGFDSIGKFSRYYNVAIVEQNGKYGMINNRCELVLPIEYDHIDYDEAYIFLTQQDKTTEVWFKDVKSIEEYETTEIE